MSVMAATIPARIGIYNLNFGESPENNFIPEN
jgi:hypothetical protein